jgi:hypothetical protein
MLAVVPLILLGFAAWGDNGIDVKITNDGTEDIVVTVYDTSTEPHAMVLTQRLNGFTTVPLSLVADPAGRANLSWSAVSVDPRSRRCGHAIMSGLPDSSSVAVHADTECTST